MLEIKNNKEKNLKMNNDTLEKEKRKHLLIAISGMPGAGKTSVSSKLVSTIPNLVYFDFGAFFRPIAFYLVKEKLKTIDDLNIIIKESRIDDLMKDLNIGFRNTNGEYEISIDGKFYKDDELYNPEMDKITVEVGTCFGDSLNKYLKSIIDEIRKKNPVLLNARRPFSVCKDISNHIFLKADFQKRAERKAVLDGLSLEDAIEYLKLRDDKELKAGFWEIFPFTKVIDTTDLEVETTAKLVEEHILGYTIGQNKDKKIVGNDDTYR